MKVKETLCEHCIFATMRGGIQNGCYLKRLEKLKYRFEDGSYIIEGFCSACRNIYWSTANNIKTNEQAAELVYKEIKLQYDVIIVCEPEDSEKSIRFTLDKIASKSYKPKRVIVTTKMTSENQSMVSKLATEYDESHTFMMSVETELPLRLKPAVDKGKSAFILFVNPGNDYDEQIINEFDEALNVELKPKFLFASEKFYICPHFLYAQYMYEENPFEEINKYVQSIASVDKRSDS